jgi:biotin transporter BioY
MMTNFDRLVVVLNALLAATAAVTNARTVIGNSEAMQRVRASIAAIAAVYVVGYGWLALYPETIVTWSKTMRGVSLIAWVVVWIVPAVVQRRSMKRVREILDKEQSRGSE